MLRLRNLRFACVLLVAVVAGACDETTPTTPTEPAPLITELFSGTITQNGAATHSFSTAAGGAVTATLKSIGVDNTLVVGFALGNWTGTACSLVLANDNATAGAVFNGTMTGIGSLCVRVYDVGNIRGAEPVAYSVEVVHP